MRLKNFCVSFFGLALVKSLTYGIRMLQLWRYELTYKLHLKTRYIHDTLTIKSPVYKKVAENKYTRPVRRATLLAFFASFSVFLLLQFAGPFLNSLKPVKVMAGSSSKTWTTNGDFAYNKSALCGETAKNNVLISGSTYTDPNCISADEDANVSLSSGNISISQISTSLTGNHTLAVRSDGTLWSWGENTNGQLGISSNGGSKTVPVQVGSDNRWAEVSAGQSFSLGIKTDGTLWSWGLGGNGQLGHGGAPDTSCGYYGGEYCGNLDKATPTQIGTSTNWSKVTAGVNFSIATKTDGTLWSWGNNVNGQLGINNYNSQYSPVQVGAVNTWTSISAGNNFVLATRTNGTLWGWGYNGNGQLGLGNTTQQPAPVQVGAITTWSSVSAGGSHAIATRTNGTLWVWGYNGSSQLGNGNTTQQLSPIQIGAITTWSRVSAGQDFSVATRTNGTLWSWGGNYYGQLGVGDKNNRTTPTQIVGSTIWLKPSAGSYSTFVSQTDGSLWGWGSNSYSKLGLNDGSERTSPVKIINTGVAQGYLDGVSVSSTNLYSSYAIKTDGTLWSWGGNGNGQLGIGSTTSISYPTQVGGASNWSKISAGLNFVLAIKADGTLWSWGMNNAGQLGLGNTTQQLSPVQIGAGTNWSEVSAGNGFSLGLKSDGTLWSWGANGFGQLGHGDTNARTSPIQVGTDSNWSKISVGDNHVLALKTNGTLWGWGNSRYGKVGDGKDATYNQQTCDDGYGPYECGSYIDQYTTSPTQIGSDVTWSNISAAASHSLAIKADATLWAWGNNVYGQLGLGNTTQQLYPVQVGLDTNWSQIGGGSNHSVAIKNTGTLWAWGSNYQGQLGTGNTTQRTSPFQVGIETTWQKPSVSSNHTILVSSDNSIRSWGNNDYGQIGRAIAVGGYYSSPGQVIISFQSFSGNMFASLGTISGFIIDAGTGARARWASLLWNGTTPTGSSIFFNARTSDDKLTWSGWSSNFTTAAGSSLVPLNASRYIDIKLSLLPAGGSSPMLNSFTATYDKLEPPVNSNLSLVKNDGVTQLKSASGTVIEPGAGGGYTNENLVKLKATDLTCNDCVNFSNPYIEVETKPVGTNFDNTTGDGSDFIIGSVDGNNESTAVLNNLVVGTGYHIQLRAVDAQGRVSSWMSYGNNLESEPDFAVEQTAPTGSMSINSGAQYVNSQNVTLSLSANDNGGSGLSEMRLANKPENDNDPIAWSGWELYSGTKNWVLSSGDGEKVVYAQFRDNAGNTSGSLDHTTTSDFANIGNDNFDAALIDNSSDMLKLKSSGTRILTTGQNVSLSCTSSDDGEFQDFVENPSATKTRFNTSGYRIGGSNNYIYVGLNGSTVQTINPVNNGSYGWAPGNKVTVYIFCDSNGVAASASSIDFGVDAYQTADFTSDVFGDGTNIYGFDTLNWDSISPNGTSLKLYLRAGNNADLSDASFSEVTNNENSLTSFGAKKYYQYKATLITNTNQDDTPNLNSVSLRLLAAAKINLDTQPPAQPSGLQVFDNENMGATEYLSSNWYGDNNVYYKWTNDPEVADYKYCIDATNTCDPSNSLTNNSFYSADLSALSDGAKYFRVKGLDGAGNPSLISFIQYNMDVNIPGAVTGFRVDSTDNDTITLKWNSAITGSPLSEYIVERAKFSSYEYYLYSGNNDDWSVLGGYGVFHFTGPTHTTTFVDSTITERESQPLLEPSEKYIYRIKVKDTAHAQYSGYQSVSVTGFTQDNKAPNDIQQIASAACDGTNEPLYLDINSPQLGFVDKCSDLNNMGFEISLIWKPTIDSGVGVEKYSIYRSDSVLLASYQKIGETTQNFYHDNDLSNLEESRLNDSTQYFYRVTATDLDGNESGLLQISYPTGNSNYNETPDVTAPTIPDPIFASAQGLDSYPPDNNDPLDNKKHQSIEITWGQSLDYKSRNSEIGSGVSTYRVYRLISGDYTDITDSQYISCNMSQRTCLDGRLNDKTTYFYKVVALDNAGNPTDRAAYLSTSASAETESNAVPTAPTNMSVVSKKGDPISDSEVGDVINISFSGSMSEEFFVNKYELYRSETNYNLATDWLNSATKVREFTITPVQDDRDGVYTHKDTGLDSSKTYYYRARAFHNNPAPNTSWSPLSSKPNTGILNSGWDITPDSIQPEIPAGGLEVKVRDTHPNELELRNIVTWKVLTSQTAPTRNGVVDFAKYIIHRESYNPNTNDLLDDEIVQEQADMSVNYYIDVIDIAFKDLKYKYYVQIEDNAGSEYKYFDGTKINDGFSNVSVKEYSADSIIPSKAKPQLVGAVELTNVNVASAEVRWTTDQDADSIVQFRPLGSTSEWQIDGQVERAVSHFVKLVNLKPNTRYEYQIVSRNYLGNNIENPGNLPPLETTGFSIGQTSSVTTTSTADVMWQTNLDASSAFIEYQLQRQGGDDSQSGTAGVAIEDLSKSPRNHRVVVKGLRSNRTYTYKIKSISTDGFVAETEFLNFKTRNYDSEQFTLAPSSSNVAERQITSTTAQIVWQTATETTTWVDYGTTSGVYDYSSGNDVLTTQHVVVLEGLVPGTTYYYRVRVKDANEVEFTSQEYTFKAILKPKISNMRVKDVTPYSVTISWDTNVETETIINWGKTAGYGEKKGISGMSKVHEIKVENLEDNQEYHYQILAKDETGNEVADEDKIIRTPLDKEGPKIENVKLDVLPMGESDASGQVIVSWTTNKPATTMVEYDEGVIGGKYSLSTVEDKSLNNSHTVIIKDLKPASSYHYRIVSKDKRENVTLSQDFTFVTPTKEKSILQLILKSLEDTFSWTKNLNQFFGNIGKRFTGR